MYIQRRSDGIQKNFTVREFLRSNNSVSTSSRKGAVRLQLESILKGDTVLARGTGTGEAETVTKDGKRTVYLDNYKETMSREEKLLMGITLGHEAYRDGLVGTEQQQFMETTRAVIGHTEMALRMQADKRYSESMDSIIGGSDILQKDIAAYKSGDMMTMLGHVAGNYDYSKDYWRLKLDGTLEVEYDKNGKLITDLNVEYLDVGGNLRKRLHIKDDTGSGSRSLARYVGEERAREILKKSFDDIATYDVQTLKDIFKLTDNQITALRHDPELKSLNFNSLSAETKERLIGEALLKNGGMDWQNNRWTENGKFSLAMSDVKDLGQIVMNKNVDGTYTRFAVSGVVNRNPYSYKSVRKGKGVADYQGLDSITLFKKDLDGTLRDCFTTTGWQTVANGYAEDMVSNKTKRAYKAEDVYRDATIDIKRNFYMRVGNFPHKNYKGPIFVLNRAYQESGSYLDTDGGWPYRNLVHSDTLNRIATSSYGKVSAGCFVNDCETIKYIQNYLTNKWGISYPYDILMKGR